MENKEYHGLLSQANSEQVPSLFQQMPSSRSLCGFDVDRHNYYDDDDSESFQYSLSQCDGQGTPTSHHENSPVRTNVLQPSNSTTSSMPASASGFIPPPPDIIFYSQPEITWNRGILQSDTCFNSLKTWSGKLESSLRRKRNNIEMEKLRDDHSQNNRNEPLPLHRYFDALEGPELDTLKPSEVSIIPDDKDWPFLLRFPISSFGICLGVSSQAILYKALATSSSTKFLHVNLIPNLILWCISVALMLIVSVIYLLKTIFYFQAVRREYFHPVRVNYFFAPWITNLLLAYSVPPSVAGNIHQCVWYTLMFPIFCLEIKIYGQWISGGQRRLSEVANPSSHLSIVGNFVGALLGASIGLKEAPIFFFSIGLAYYVVLFVTLHQRLTTNKTLAIELHPVFFLFVAAPSVACTAWAQISDKFDCGSKIAYFISLFLYICLAIRWNLFRGFRFSLAWWAYTFPMTGAAVASIAHATEVKNRIAQTLSVALSAFSTLAAIAILCSTIFHAFILQDLFPKDHCIAITETKSTTITRIIRSASETAEED